MQRLPRWLLYALVLETLAFAAVGVLWADMALHRRAAERDGLNQWGYRGPIARRRQPREQRMVFVGGSAIFGAGVPLVWRCGVGLGVILGVAAATPGGGFGASLPEN